MKKAALFQDLTELAAGAATLVTGIRDQLKAEARSRMSDIANRADLVSRVELDRIEGMIKKARMVQEDILKRLDVLEGKKTPKPSAPQKKPVKSKKKQTVSRKK